MDTILRLNIFLDNEGGKLDSHFISFFCFSPSSLKGKLLIYNFHCVILIKVRIKEVDKMTVGIDTH
jgi:hypothetical protein